jgi:fluoride exporter
MGVFPLAQVCAVSIGAAIGALLRWLAGLWLNGAPSRVIGFPLGTLLVNCAGGLMIGAALFYFERTPNELYRLLVITGFLGGLTTFSSFSVESLIMIQRGEWALALGHTLAHVLGALVFAAIGFGAARALFD